MGFQMWIVWFAIAVGLIILECLTVNLVSIWFAGGAIAAMLVSFTKANFAWQLVAFVVVSGVLLVATKPFVKKVLKKKEKTNCDMMIGKNVIVTEKVDNIKQTGAIVYNGLEWTARSAKDEVTFEKGENAIIMEINGVKVILMKEDKE